jgi:VWFA-related protein
MRALNKGLGPLESGVPANIVERQEMPDVIKPDTATLQNKANIDIQRQAERGQMTLDDFSSMAKWLGVYPGRKNVFWLSSGFPLEGQPFGVLGPGPGTQAGQRLPMQEKTDKALENARVAIYPIDVRGVAVPDITGETNADTEGNGMQMIDVNKDDDLKTAELLEMLEIAHATGGTARFNNDLTKSLRDAWRQGESYYTLSYTPQNTKWDGGYHRIQIAVNEPGVQLVYRQGYYARDAEPEPSPTTDQFRAALEPGSLSAISVLFTARVVTAADSAEVQYAIDPSTIQFVEDSDGKLLADLDCAILEFNGKGKVLEKSLIRLSEKVGPEQRAQISAKSLEAKQTIALRPGATTLVVGVRDRSTGQFGSLEVNLAER